MLSKHINWRDAAFLDPERERAYQAYAAIERRGLDFLLLFIGLIVYEAYAVMDVIVLENSALAIALRTSAVIVSFVVMTATAFGVIKVHYDKLIPVLVVLLGAILCGIIYLEPTLENSYFVGLIQLGVFACFVPRSSFLRTAAALCLMTVFFIVAAFDKFVGGESLYVQQLAFLCMMFCTALAGLYMLEVNRRELYLTTARLQERTKTLDETLGELNKTLERRTLLLRHLSHVMRTPTHQLIGFLQLANALDKKSGDYASALQHAVSAGAQISKLVASLIDLQRVESNTSEPQIYDDSLKMVFVDLGLISSDIFDLKWNGPDPRVNCDIELARIAFKHLTQKYKDERLEITEVNVRHLGDKVVASIPFGIRMSAAEFESLICPIEDIRADTDQGANPDLELRVASAAFRKFRWSLGFNADASALEIVIPMKAAA